MAIMLEQGISGPDPINKIAERVGSAVGVAQFNIARGLSTLRDIGRTIFELSHPFATSNYTITESFNPLQRQKIETAVKASKLPEGVSFVTSIDDFPVGVPFVVVGIAPDYEQIRNAIRAGALRYIVGLEGLSPEELRKKLDAED